MNITMPRGDIRKIKFSVKNSTGEIFHNDFDEIYFTCKRDFNDRNYIFQKRLSDGSITKSDDGYYHLTILASDTDYLKYGNYLFDIEVIQGDTVKQTTVGTLILTYEVTHARNEGD